MYDIDDSKAIKTAVLVAVVTPDYDVASLDELKELVENIGLTESKTILQYRNEPNNATCVGSGKLKEIKDAITFTNAEIVVFDNRLSPMQLRNIEDALDIQVIDRTGIILQIFARRANSLEGKIQVELAQLQYLLPRLKGKGSSLSRLAGGIGTRGPGESKLETDRRHIQRRINHLKRQLQQAEKNKLTQRRMREKNHIPQVSLCGYTNAGKSTLLNQLTEADVFACDMLFATLDSTTRRLKLPSGKEILLSDTVGFIRNLPHELIYAFKSTLDEIAYSNLIILVCDSTSKNLDTEIDVVRATINELGYKGEMILAYNKLDKTEPDIVHYPEKGSLYISAKAGVGLDKLLKLIDEKLAAESVYEFRLPYEKIEVYYYFKKKQKVMSENFMLDALSFSATVNEIDYAKYSEWIMVDKR